MTLHRCIRVFSFAALLIIVPAGVFAQDVDAMAKWTALTIVHYRVVGEYSAEVPLLADSATKAQATDRIELEFDWDQFEMKMSGEAKITNAPTASTPIAVGSCPPARPSGPLEIATVLSVKNAPAPGMVDVAIKSDTPAGSAPRATDTGPCGSEWAEVAASSAPKNQMLQIMPAMMLAMGPNPTMVTPDGKSLFVKGAGWTWTFTPTAVR